MDSRRLMWIGLGTFGAAALLSVSVVAGGQQTGSSGQGSKMVAPHDMKMSGSPMTKAQKIANALTAAPSSVSAKATIYDYPEKEGGMPIVLRPGTNGWSCFPDMPETKGNDPMCADESWMKWIEAYLAHKTPVLTKPGISYMLGSDGYWGSNTDPYGLTETATNQWSHHDPHLMLLYPDVKVLAGLPTDPNNGGPYVMYAGTPYAHIMAPIRK